MAEITEAQALGIVSLETMKFELRIPASETAHDALLTSQIVSAVSYVARVTGRSGDGLLELQPGAVAVVRDLYNGNREVSEDAAQYAWLAPFRSYKQVD